MLLKSYYKIKKLIKYICTKKITYFKALKFILLYKIKFQIISKLLKHSDNKKYEIKILVIY